MRLLLSGRVGIQGVLGVVAGTLLMTVPARPAAAADETIFRSPDLRIFHALDRNGNPTVVLTNLDDEGNRLGGGGSELECADLQGRVGPAGPPAASQALSGRQESGGQGPSRRGGEVNVVVNQGDGVEKPLEGGDVEVRNGEGGGTTVIVNI
ncbi:MAG TPA: hypothetical protein VJ144_07380, partial [Candidatus Polarisedimenticolia bacterium]|nr:hypothetical protein [Candidatus Polarisedimenticolia bacterium]